MMSDPITSHQLRLGPTWELNPPVYLNFVKWIVQQRQLKGAYHPRMLQEVISELHKWNLTLQDNSVQGNQEDLTAWMLAYA